MGAGCGEDVELDVVVTTAVGPIVPGVDEAIAEVAEGRDATIELKELDVVVRTFQPTTAMAPTAEVNSSLVVASFHAA